MDAWFERQVLMSADHVITGARSHTANMRALVPLDRRDGRFTTITFAYENEPRLQGDISSVGELFSIVYSGTLYDGSGFLRALRQLREERPAFVERIRVRLVGKLVPVSMAQCDLASEVTSLNQVIEQVGWVSHGKSLEYVANGDLLLLISDTHRGPACVPGKVFEYMATGKPILALVPPGGEAARLVRETRTGWVIDPDDVQAIKGFLPNAYQAWKAGQLHIEPQWEQIELHSAKNTAEQLAQILETIVPW